MQVLSRTRITARCRDVDGLGRKKARARRSKGKENAHSFAFFFFCPFYKFSHQVKEKKWLVSGQLYGMICWIFPSGSSWQSHAKGIPIIKFTAQPKSHSKLLHLLHLLLLLFLLL